MVDLKQKQSHWTHGTTLDNYVKLCVVVVDSKLVQTFKLIS